MIPFLPGEIVQVRRLFHPLGRATFQYFRCRVLKQVLFNNPAYRVVSIPGEAKDPEERSVAKWQWVVDGVWVSPAPVNICKDLWTRISEAATVTHVIPVTEFRKMVAGSPLAWKIGAEYCDREYGRNGSPFGRVGRETKVVWNLPNDDTLTGFSKNGHGQIKRKNWLKKQSFTMKTKTIALRKGDAGGWEWVIGLARQSCNDDEARKKRSGPVLPYKPPSPREAFNVGNRVSAQAQVENDGEGGDAECLGAGSGGEPRGHAEGYFAEGDTPVVLPEEGSGHSPLRDVWEAEENC